MNKRYTSKGQLVRRPLYNKSGWVLCECSKCGKLNYVEPHGTTTICPSARCGKFMQEHVNLLSSPPGTEGASSMPRKATCTRCTRCSHPVALNGCTVEKCMVNEAVAILQRDYYADVRACAELIAEEVRQCSNQKFLDIVDEHVESHDRVLHPHNHYRMLLVVKNEADIWKQLWDNQYSVIDINDLRNNNGYALYNFALTGFRRDVLAVLHEEYGLGNEQNP